MELPPDPLAGFYPVAVPLRVAAPPRLPPPRLVRPVPVDPTGRAGPTPNRARGPLWRRTSPGLYVPADTGPSPAQRILEASGHLPATGAVTGWASLHLAGAKWFEGQDATGRLLPVPLALGSRHLIKTPGVLPDRRALHPEEVVHRHGVPCTTVHRAVLDEMRRRADLRAAVVVIDMAMYAELTSRSRFGAYLSTLHRVPGLPLAREALSLAAEGAESPREVGLRLVWELDAGLPRPLCNHEVFDLAGNFLARPDLLDPARGVVGEYDGAHHLRAASRSKDLGREGMLRDHGLEYFAVVAGEGHDVDRVVARIRATFARAESSALAPRWTLAPPGERPLTLDERIDARLARRLSSERDSRGR